MIKVVSPIHMYVKMILDPSQFITLFSKNLETN